VRVLPEVKQGLDAQGIKLIAEPTNEACQIYNQLCHSQESRERAETEERGLSSPLSF